MSERIVQIENDILLKNGSPHCVDFDDHSFHIKEHSRLLKELRIPSLSKWDNLLIRLKLKKKPKLPSETVTVILNHIQEHIDLVNKINK